MPPPLPNSADVPPCIPRDADRRRIFLMRHGSVSYFDDAGRPHPPDGVSLNDLGRRQADAAGEVLGRARLRFDRVIVSGLPRTVETARRVLAATGQSTELEVWPDLVELRGGKLARIPDDALRDAFVGAFEGVAEESSRFLGGESIGELLDRVLPAVDRLRAAGDWDVVLLVLHGGVNRAILSYLLTGRRSFLGGLHQAPACINALDVGAARGDVVLRVMNHAPTDEAHTSTRKTTMEQLYEQYRKLRSRFGDDFHG